MFYRGYPILTSLGRPESVPSPRALCGQRPLQEADFQRAMNRELPEMPLSERLKDPGRYLTLQRARRQSLEVLLTAEPDDDLLRRAVDLICMICEESCWSENPGTAPFDDDAHPEIDYQCAETAVLLGWTARAFGDRLTSRVSGKLLYEVRRRVFSPLLAHEDYPFMRARGRRPLAILSDLLMAAMLLETVEQRRASLLKLLLRLIDQAIDVRSQRVEALEDAAADTAAITDLSVLLRRITRDSLDLTPTYPTPDWLDQLLYPWLEGECFVDPAGGSMLPRLSGEDLFRIGLCANDDALTALGASLERSKPVPSCSVTGRLLAQSCRQMLDAAEGKPPRIKRAATPRNRVMVSRFSGMTFAMHTGGDCANAGGIALFSGRKPVLVEAGDACSLPSIGGRRQQDRPDLACEADFDLRQDRDTMSVELTQAWPAGVAHSCQRTAIIQRPDVTLRLVDAFDLAEPSTVAFRFISAQQPQYMPGGLRLGDVDFTWEGGLEAEVLELGRRFPDPVSGEPLYEIRLTAPSPVSRAVFSFNFAKS